MKELSPDRQSYLAQLIVDDLLKTLLISDSSSRDLIFQKVKAGISLFAEEWKEVNRSAEQKISNLKRNVVPGSAEWETLYGQYIEELFQKKSVLFTKE